MKIVWLVGAAIVLLCVATLGISVVIAVVNAHDQASSAGETAHTTQRILIRSCRDNGNPLRMAVREMLQDEIKQSHSPFIYKAFPQFSHRRLNRKIGQANRTRRKLIRQIKPVDCSATYHH